MMGQIVTSGQILDGGHVLLEYAKVHSSRSPRRLRLIDFEHDKRAWISAHAAVSKASERPADKSDVWWAERCISFARWHAQRARNPVTKKRRPNVDLLKRCGAFETLVRRAATFIAIGIEGNIYSQNTSGRAPYAPGEVVLIGPGSKQVLS